MRRAWIVFDLGFGDAGKGTITDYLVRRLGAKLVVRWNGGGQAGHNVVDPEGRHHTFAQFGSGSFVPGVATLLGPGFVLHPGGMLREAACLSHQGVRDALMRTTIDRRALVVAPPQQAAGRLRELLRGARAHGTTGVGVGETVADSVAGHEVVRAGDLLEPHALRRKLERIWERKREDLLDRPIGDPRAAAELRLLENTKLIGGLVAEWAQLGRRLRLVEDSAALVEEARTVVFEGAQGVLLDETWGFHPHTTWGDCTPRGALELISGRDFVATRIAVTRAWSTRHGAGPFPTDEPAHARLHSERHQDETGWQGRFRTGPLDLVLLRYALEVAGGAEGLALTCLDRAQDPLRVAIRYSNGLQNLSPGAPNDLDWRARLGGELSRVRPVFKALSQSELSSFLEAALDVPVAIESWGPTWVDKSEKRRLEELAAHRQDPAAATGSIGRP